MNPTGGTSTSAPNNRGGAPQPAPSAQKDLQRRAADAGHSIAVADTASTHRIAEGSVTTPGLDPALVTAAMQESNAIVQRALSAGQWTPADNAAIRRHLRLLPSEERLQIMLKVLRAAERRELTLAPGTPPPT